MAEERNYEVPCPVCGSGVVLSASELGTVKRCPNCKAHSRLGIPTPCPVCGEQVILPAVEPGRAQKCPACGAFSVFRVPDAAAPPAAVPVASQPAASDASRHAERFHAKTARAGELLAVLGYVQMLFGLLGAIASWAFERPLPAVACMVLVLAGFVYVVAGRAVRVLVEAAADVKAMRRMLERD